MNASAIGSGWAGETCSVREHTELLEEVEHADGGADGVAVGILVDRQGDQRLGRAWRGRRRRGHRSVRHPSCPTVVGLGSSAGGSSPASSCERRGRFVAEHFALVAAQQLRCAWPRSIDSS